MLFEILVQTATETAAHPSPTMPETPADDAGLSILVITLVLLAYWAMLAFIIGWIRIFIARGDGSEPDSAAERQLFREIQNQMLTEIPWNLVKRATEHIRRTYYTKAWPDEKPGLIVTSTPAEVEEALRKKAYFEGSPYSYDYEGAVLDLRRPHGTDEAGVPMEIHVRGRPMRDGAATELIAHIEYSRYEAKQLHIDADSESLRWEEAREEMRDILADAGAAGATRHV